MVMLTGVSSATLTSARGTATTGARLLAVIARTKSSDAVSWPSLAVTRMVSDCAPEGGVPVKRPLAKESQDGSAAPFDRAAVSVSVALSMSVKLPAGRVKSTARR
jgi:hypothetical protein